MKVLVIEDDPTHLKLMGAVLQIGGHSVDARSAAEGVIDAIAADKPDVILLDLRLPGMDGMALVRQLKATTDTRQIPIVAMTAYPDRYRREELLAAGCEAFIVKPINTRELPEKLEKIAGKEPR
jgi:two-component system, cell cycle response regulator